MLDFKAKMHEIQFRLGLRPRSCWGSLQRSPRTYSGIKRGPTSKEREGEEWGKGRERKERGGRGRKKREREGTRPQVTVEPGDPLRALLRHCWDINTTQCELTVATSSPPSDILFIYLIIEYNSGTIKIELDNTVWTVQPEQGRKAGAALRGRGHGGSSSPRRGSFAPIGQFWYFSSGWPDNLLPMPRTNN